MTTGQDTVVRSREAQDYLDGVAAQLADLPVDDRADLLDELAAHLDELAAESDSPLTARLGSPVEYAAELRASAGLPPAGARGHAVGELMTRLRALASGRRAASVKGFATSLRPVWWLVRAWVVVGLVAMWPGQSSRPWSGNLPFAPRVVTPEVGLILVAVAVWASVQLGRRAWSAPRRAVVVLNVVAALAVLPVLASCVDQANNVEYIQEGALYPTSDTRVPPEGVYANGNQVWNLYAYDAQGNLLHDVRLYDQDGAPLSLGLAPDVTRRPAFDSLGRVVDNVFPYRYVEPDGTVADPDAGPTVDAPALVVPPTAGTTPAPTPSGTGSPAASRCPSAAGKR
jgi:hypothetical protein